MTHFSGHRLADLDQFGAEVAAARNHERFRSFAELVESEGEEGSTYSRDVIYRDSEIAIVAPHGGFIEPGTDPLARQIAGEDLSLYVFQALDAKRADALHITSTRFDDPKCLLICNSARTVLTVHGCLGDYSGIFVGGRDTQLRDKLIACFKAGSLASGIDRVHPGQDPQNLCNRGTSGAGVQIELTAGLRDSMSDPNLRAEIARIIRTALAEAQSATVFPDTWKNIGAVS